MDRNEAERSEARRSSALAVLVLALIVLSAAPTFTWLEFSNGSENLNISTALEMRRTGQWLFPTLQGEPRLAKPPLTAWITATAISDATMNGLSDPDPSRRQAARRALAIEGRWPFLVSGLFMLLALWRMALVLTDHRTALIALAVGATSLIFLRFGRAAATDAQLALWVTVANWLIAETLFHRSRWLGPIGAGAAIGLAFMSKGPVAIVQTVLPTIPFLLVARFRPSTRPPRGKPRWIPLAAASLACLALALPWFVAAAARWPEAWTRWRIEVLRDGATGLPPGPWWAYLVLLPFLLPWTLFLFSGSTQIFKDVRAAPDAEQSRKLFFAVLMLVIPILVMSVFRDRKDRYLLPMLAPAAIVVARGVAQHLVNWPQRRTMDRVIGVVHWAGMLATAVGLPVAGATLLRTTADTPWYSVPQAVAIACGLGLIALIGIGFYRQRRASLVATTFLLTLAANLVFLAGYRNSREGRSEMKPMADLIWDRYPDATVVTSGPRRKIAPIDLSIYLNRPVAWVDSAAVARQVPGRVVMVIRQEEDEPLPEQWVGYSAVAKVQRDKSWWYAYVRGSSLTSAKAEGPQGE